MKQLFLSFTLCLFFFGNTFAQESTTIETETPPPQKKFELGIGMGLHYGYLKVENSDWQAQGIANEINDLQTENKLGFSLNCIYKFNLTKMISLIPQSIISFQDSNVNYNLENQETQSQVITPVTIELPVHVVFTGYKNEKVNPAVTIGARYSYNIAADLEKDVLKLSQHDYALDLGTGLEVKFNRFKMKPQLLYSFGLNNLKTDADNIYNASVDHISRDKIAFRVLFYN